ncbi:Gfo/Idh/MocA family oxidoreductase [Irregularibacter muris]|uniref:Gfo/Idh/MocA family oxidoreductase n=1 Tax=Irregularibacter muris TaxID=1796619 RepID=A0AAE3HEN5_9FIRM|nr:Gfo/Idh/MocA family oxidoreductase [Irregularibacter muris]MCR1899125.1 Gfo/Idh/MocA family oxidoreductase [Irregularibacter muris]
MIRFGVIGTSWITEEFIRCASLVKDFQLNAVYSRTEKRASEFAGKYGIKHVFTDLEEMAASNVLEAVYIASPNSYHSKQAILFLKNNIHTLCEKPIASNTTELTEMINTARENNVVLMEAMKSIYLPNFKAIKDNLCKIGKIHKYFASYCQYSSRYDLYKAGENPNTFDKKFSNGSLMDIGIYCIYPLITLFGIPKDIKASGTILKSGVDGEGNLLLQYDDMNGVIIHSKITDSSIEAEIQGEKGNMIIDKIHTPEKIIINYRNGEREDITISQSQDILYYETYQFIESIKNRNIESEMNTLHLSLQVMEVLDSARKQVGIIYPADIEQKSL